MNISELKIGDKIAKLPIIQGGMGIGVSLSKLASAVANAGGIGIISGAQPGYKEPDFRTDNETANLRGLEKEIRKAKELSPEGIIGVNFLASVTNYADMVKLAVQEKVDLIISGAGLPKNLPSFVIGTDTKIAPIVSSGKAASTITRLWTKKYDYLPDAIIVEGPKAGGHLGFSVEDLKENMPNIKDIVADVLQAVKEFEEKYNKKIPVIAAGGIFSGQDIAECLEQGAAGVQMSTQFVATEECDAHENFKEAYINSHEEDIQLIVSPVGLPGRALRNKFVETVEASNQKIKHCYRCLRGCNPATTPYCITEALVASVEGDVDNGLVFIGSNGHKLEKITKVKDLMQDLIDEANAYFKK
ncbi:nitronate monooxygenase [Acidaminobacter sp. JC074]|uniref:NAD(P)H-dependent flavin oxidoreductase n=1 Tax=Acidaminobacter sp. JC074 TaxID=2530199 RepID=UPI001F0D838E|nr:nitronate monooxygenase [Acidaminobacter sp. JC074]MCH4889013.1 nitronate monooxygenase [Acidaminobacter sp. JC074]